MIRKANRIDPESQSFADSLELFESLFRNELDALRRDKLKKPEFEAQSRNVKVKREILVSTVKHNSLKNTGTKADEKTSGTEKARVASKEKNAKDPNKLKIGLLSLMSTVLLAAFLIHSAILNSSRLLPSSESTKKQNEKPYEAKKVPVRTNRKKPDTMSIQIEKSEDRKEPSITQDIYPGADKTNDMEIELPKRTNSLMESLLAITEKDQSSMSVFLLHEKEGSDNGVFILKQRVSSFPYSIYFGSYRTVERLQRAMSLCTRMNLSAYWVEIDLGEKGVWFRAFAGFFKTRAHADAFIRENRIDGASSRNTKYALLIGNYTSKQEIETKRVALLELGYSSYVIQDANGEFLLYTGAFYQKVRALKHGADLASDGIQNQVVER